MSQAFRWVIRFCVILVSIAGAGSVNAGFIPILLDETNFQKAIPNTAVPLTCLSFQAPLEIRLNTQSRVIPLHRGTFPNPAL